MRRSGRWRRWSAFRDSDERCAPRPSSCSNRAANARVFGSVLHGDDGDESDLDILVDALPGATLLDLGAIQVELEDLLGVSVDVVTPQDLPPKFRREVLDEARAV
ncbi:nucleotidyltransferase family protein [Caballeronia ptereochthonis]|uniref:DNA polymerase beta subunit n=1 Tax=Caballeronia ptereochthonis TaxID=1777144 RepID=A0A158BMV3_9BURK|nr:DNA polymerase beta subunit [Caballeronia ptereochthonis]